MRTKDFFDILLKIIDENTDHLFTAWLTHRQFEKWLQLEILTKLMVHYESFWGEDFGDYFHSEYRAYLTQYGKHKKKFKQVDIYISNGKNDSNDYMFIELKTGFGKSRTIPVASIIDDFKWLTKIKKHELAKEIMATIVLLSCTADALDKAKNDISSGIGRKPSFIKTVTIIKKQTDTGKKFTVYALAAIWKMKKS